MEFMQPRIRAFDNVYRERLLARLFAIGPDQNPDDHRAMLAEFLIPRHPLVRQTNRHHLLPADKLEQFWTGTGEEREEIMEEFEAGEAAAEYEYDLPEDDEERDAGALGPLYYEDFDEVAGIFLE